jgi:hypothetical protein
MWMWHQHHDLARAMMLDQGQEIVLAWPGPESSSSFAGGLGVVVGVAWLVGSTGITSDLCQRGWVKVLCWQTAQVSFYTQMCVRVVYWSIDM